MIWDDVLKKQPLFLNLGGGSDCHPRSDYKNYISVDLKPPFFGWAVLHNLTEPFPLPDNSVDRILAEEVLEHLSMPDVGQLLMECYRILKPGGMMRIGVPDYNHPKDSFTLKLGYDPRYPNHKILTTYSVMLNLLERTPFQRFEFYHFWDKGEFIHKPIDYSMGVIKRTPENYMKYQNINLRRMLVLFFRKRIKYSAIINVNYAFGHPLYATSIVIDVFKSAPR
jgi:predicted SAM-dependent methyltransferase